MLAVAPAGVGCVVRILDQHAQEASFLEIRPDVEGITEEVIIQKLL
ncbi:hypothetical protein FLACOL7796_00292 [Flavobacterium collinsii]|uniref:Uncharacterized protein n=1 Tax=Flavobacterium collinsii TaxID=1114861 RepID=A0ABM8KDH3_9FLAO|nr:hypothetical protein FLACOL7796_00292 [Flavobacterium collinsii]